MNSLARQYVRLGPDDVPTMREVLAVFAAAFEDSDAYLSAQPTDSYLRRLLQREYFIALAATEAGTVIAGLTAYVLEKCEQERSEVFVYDLAVAQSHRRQGVATGLLRHLQGVATVCGARVIFVQADADDEPAIKLYASLGKRTDVHHFDICVS